MLQGVKGRQPAMQVHRFSPLQYKRNELMRVEMRVEFVPARTVDWWLHSVRNNTTWLVCLYNAMPVLNSKHI